MIVNRRSRQNGSERNMPWKKSILGWISSHTLPVRGNMHVIWKQMGLGAGGESWKSQVTGWNKSSWHQHHVTSDKLKFSRAELILPLTSEWYREEVSIAQMWGRIKKVNAPLSLIGMGLQLIIWRSNTLLIPIPWSSCLNLFLQQKCCFISLLTLHFLTFIKYKLEAL